MKIKFLSAFIASILMISAVHADVNSLKLQTLPNTPLLTPAVSQRLQQEYQQQINLLQNAKVNITNLALDSKIKKAFVTRVDENIQKLNMLSKKSISSNDLAEVNFLDIKINDALLMMEYMKNSARLTTQILEKMTDIAIKAADGTHGYEALAGMNDSFQAYKQALRYIQSGMVLNGEKTVSGGDLSIRIGENNNEATLVTVKIPAFDSAALDLTELNVTSATNAMESLATLRIALTTMNSVNVAVNSIAMDDARAMLLTIPYVLNQDYQLFITAWHWIVESCNGTLGDANRALLDQAFTELKALIVKTQTFVALSGPKKLGGGTVHIQIGQYATPETTLDIPLPATDINVIGLDRENIQTQDNAYRALDTMLKTLHDFAYSTGN